MKFQPITPYYGDPESKGSNCCEASVKEIDGVIICTCCCEPAEEVFEDDEEMEERLLEEAEGTYFNEAEFSWESEREGNE